MFYNYSYLFSVAPTLHIRSDKLDRVLSRVLILTEKNVKPWKKVEICCPKT